MLFYEILWLWSMVYEIAVEAPPREPLEPCLELMPLRHGVGLFGLAEE